MAEQKLIKKQRIKNMLLNFIAFTVIFSVLGIILYVQVEGSIYQSSDTELLNSKNRMGIIEKLTENAQNVESNTENLQEIQNQIQNQNQSQNQNQANSFEKEPPRENNFKEDNFKKERTMINPRIIYIIRDSLGNIKDNNDLNENFNYVEFDKNSLNTIYTTKVNNEYSYRCINYEITQEGEILYVQAFINVDAEEHILNNFTITLIIAIIITIVASLIASYILSKITLKPIIQSWKKQTEFVQNASHELRTPLTIIQAKQELLLENPESKIVDNAEDIGISLSETRRLSKLIRELMQLARADSNKLELNKQGTDIDSLIKEVVMPFNEMAKAQEKQIFLDLNYGKNIHIDSNKIHELLIIILDNSMKYTENGDTITIKTYEKDSKLVIDIADTGIGISDEAIDHVFERFYREDKAHSRETGGSGLGLSIANSIVQAHGGTIKAMKNKPKGTIIQIKLNH